MDELGKKIQYILYVIIVLGLLNLTATAILVYRFSRTSGPMTTPSNQRQLPIGLQTSEERMALFVKLKDAYNSGSNSELRSLLDPAVRMEQSEEEFDNAMDQSRSFLGKILEGAYLYYEAISTSQNVWTWRLFFRLRAEQGKAILTIIVAQQNAEPFRIVGFNLSSR